MTFSLDLSQKLLLPDKKIIFNNQLLSVFDRALSQTIFWLKRMIRSFKTTFALYQTFIELYLLFFQKKTNSNYKTFLDNEYRSIYCCLPSIFKQTSKVSETPFSNHHHLHHLGCFYPALHSCNAVQFCQRTFRQ